MRNSYANTLQVGARQRRPLAIAALTVVLGAALALPSAAGAATKALNTDLTWGISSSDQDRTIAATTDLGAGWLRLNMTWSEVETKNGSYSNKLNMYDQAINKAHASGANVLVTVYQSPSWASGSSNPETPPTNPADYADFLTFVANRYQGKVQAWQVWNEQNYSRFWSTGPDAGRYAQLLKAAHGAIKGVDPNLTVVFGGLSLNDYAFVEAAYAAMPDLGSYYDVMASHPYTFPVASPETVTFDGNGRVAKGSFPGYREIRSVMLAHGDDKPMWFTELGWSSNSLPNGVSEALQADFLRRAYDCIEQDPYVEVAFWYSFRNNYWANDADNWEDRLGLVRTDFSHKPAYDAFKAYTPDGGGCQYAYPEPPVPPVPPVTDPPVEPEPPVTDPPVEPEPPVEPTQPEEEGTVTSSSVVGSMSLRIVRVDRRARVSKTTRRAARRTRLRIAGRVKGATRGRVRLVLERKVDGDWRRRARYRPAVSDTGRFRTGTTTRRQGRWRVRAIYRADDAKRVRPRPLRFRI